MVKMSNDAKLIKKWEYATEKRSKARRLWLTAMTNMPVAANGKLVDPTIPLAQCLEISKKKVGFKYEQGSAMTGIRWEMLKKLAHPEYGRVFAAIRLTALGVADQYDWSDK